MSQIRELIERAISLLGSEAKLAAAAGVAQPSINEAKKKGRVGAKMAAGIDAATDGRVSKNQLRPDLWPKQFEERRQRPMTTTVNIGEAATRLSDLLARVEAGEDITIVRGAEPVARLTRIEKAGDLASVIAEARAARARAKPVTRDEILAWRREGARQ
jgi:prevent-host-death family protein